MRSCCRYTRRRRSYSTPTEISSTSAAIPGTTSSRPLSDLTTNLQYPDLHEEARDTRTLASSEKPIPTDDGRWFTVRIMPYRRLDNVIDGVVITLVDITDTVGRL
ncbi:MAG: PAS domain-containing protein [Thioalkalivibrio sp.]|nr:PAS domain-containing protein [Thioalkalivibrio sp.]